MQKFSARLKGLRARRALTQSDLAAELGVSLGSVGNWESEQNIPAPGTLRKFADFFEVSPAYLLGEPESVKYSVTEKHPSELREGEMEQGQFAPVVSWASAGSGGDYEDLADFMKEWVKTDCKDPNKYALIIDGDSMVEKFLPGDRIVLAPNEEARNGDHVVARLRTGEAYFKLYHYDPNNDIVKLTSYHPAYPAMEYKRSDFRFIHPVWEMRRPMRGRK